MNQNPYQPPADGYPPGPPNGLAGPKRTLFLLAAVGAALASVYWAIITMLTGLSVTTGSASPARLFLPLVLIALYAYRGYQLLIGNVAAARRIVFLHALGCVGAILMMATASGILVFLQGFKVAIHVFGGTTAYLAQRAPRYGGG